MGLLKRLARLFSSSTGGQARPFYSLAVQCQRCGEVISAQIDLHHELSADYDERGALTGHRSRKVLIGRQRCYQAIEVELMFDAERRLTGREVRGGVFVDA